MEMEAGGNRDTVDAKWARGGMACVSPGYDASPANHVRRGAQVLAGSPWGGEL